ncbi:MAG: PrgI family protein [Peptostreptococcaceae bacterium]
MIKELISISKTYQIPPNTDEEEKFVGGVITFIQFFWLLGGGVLFAVNLLFWHLVFGQGILGGIIGLPLLLLGVPFAFYKKKELTLFKYIKLKMEFNKKSKRILNKRKDM